MTEVPAEFYGVYIAPQTEEIDDGELLPVYTDKREVFKLAKKYKGARFKSFRNHDEALYFAVHGTDNSLSSTLDTGLSENMTLQEINIEKPSPFKAPKPQECVKLRRAIEAGDIATMLGLIWSNPKYLIGSGDTPTILQEGRRFNALHAAANAGHSEACKTILNILEDPEFMCLMYPDDSEVTRGQRIKYLLDLYLNMPCKSLNETPLHYAAKFGHKSVVEVLVSYGECSKEQKNKYGDIPAKLICSRTSKANADLVRAIEEALSERFVIPLLRSSDNATPAIVMAPQSPTKTCTKSDVLNLTPKSPVSPSMEIRAFAGPMPGDKAGELYIRWKGVSKRRDDSPNRTLRIQDPNKGWERIGRYLAKEYNVPWSEYWEFVNCYCDLKTPEGLNILEKYLKEKFVQVNDERNLSLQDISTILPDLQDISFNQSLGFQVSSIHHSPEEDVTQYVNNNNSTLSPISRLCNDFQDLKLDSLSSSSEYSSTENIENKTTQTVEVKQHREENGYGKPCNPIQQCCDAFGLHICNDLILNLNKLCGTSAKRSKKLLISIIVPELNRFHSILGQQCYNTSYLHYSLAIVIVQNLRDTLSVSCIEQFLKFLSHYITPVRTFNFSSDEDDENVLHSYRYHKPKSPTKLHLSITHCWVRCMLKAFQSNRPTEYNCSCNWELLTEEFKDNDSEENFNTAPNSLGSGRSTPMDLQTPDEGVEVYIVGCKPTKTDLDVLTAIGDTYIDPVLYPNITRWKHLTTLTSEHERMTWPNPACHIPQSPSAMNDSFNSPIRTFGSPVRLNPLPNLTSTPTRPMMDLRRETLFKVNSM